MSHKTMVNGTVYEIDGGKTLIDGVAYSIDKGKTLVGGTAYEVGFAQPVATITLPMIYWVKSSLAYLMIDGVKYTNSTYATQTLEVPIGTIVECWVYTESRYESARVNLYDENTYMTSRLFTQSTRDVWGTYYYTVTTNISIDTSYDEDNEKGDRYGIITITEE